jgi:hypothetical protein
MPSTSRILRDFCRRFFTVFRSSGIVLLALSLFIRQLFVDDDPPRFPLPPESNPIDCFSFTSTKIWAESSRVKVEVDIGDFLEYPREIAYTLLNITVTAGPLSFSYPPRQFWDISSNLSRLYFCILQSVGGFGLTCSLYCHGNLLAKNAFDLREIEVFPVGWSRMVPAIEAVARFRDVCFDSTGKFVFFTRAETVFPDMRLASDFVLPVVVNASATEIYRQAVGAKREQAPTLFVAAVAKEASRVFAFVVLPVVAAFLQGFANRDSEVVLMRPEEQMNLVASIQPVVDEVKVLTGDVCYSQMIFVRAPGYLRPYETKEYSGEVDALVEHFEYLFEFNEDINRPLRARYVGGDELFKGRVVLDESLAHKAQEFEKLCNGCEFVVLNESMTVPEIARIVGTAQVFVGGTLFADLLAMFMHRDATYIEVPTDGAECTQFGRRFAPRKYITGYDEKECQCDIRCYLEKPVAHRNMNDHRVKAAIAWGLER